METDKAVHDYEEKRRKETGMIQQTVTAVHVDRLPEKEEMERGKFYVADRLRAEHHSENR